MKKLLSVLLLSLFIFSFSYADDNKKVNPKLLEINLNFYKKKLKNKENWEKYIEVLDKKLFSFSEEKLKKLRNSIEEYLKTYKWKHFDLLKYAKFKIDIILMDWKTENKNWDLKIYRSEDFWFEILYNKSSDVTLETSWVEFWKWDDKDFMLMVVDYYSIKKIKKLSDYIDFMIKEDISKSWKNIKKEEIKLNWIIWYKLSFEWLNLFNWTNYNEIYMFGNENEGILYFIVFYNNNYKYKNQIIESFKIINKIQKQKLLKAKEDMELKYELEALDSLRKSHLRSISMLLFLYKAENKKLPESLDSLKEKFKDKKDWQTINWCKFWYTYEKISDREYRLSTCMESEYWKKQAKEDGWIYENKYEVHEKLKD